MSFPQTRPMVTRQRKGYGPGVWSTWTELRSSRTISKIKKNRGKSLSRSHRAMTSMRTWSSSLSENIVESVGCKVILHYTLCAFVCLKGVTVIARVKIQRGRNCRSNLWVRTLKFVPVTLFFVCVIVTYLKSVFMDMNSFEKKIFTWNECKAKIWVSCNST